MKDTKRKPREVVFTYLDIPLDKRQTLRAFLAETGLSPITYYKWKKEYTPEWNDKAKLMEADIRSHAGLIEDGLNMEDDRERCTTPLGEYDSHLYLEGRTIEVDKSLIDKCLKGDPRAMQLYYQLMGRMVDKKQTVIVNLEGDDYYRLRNLARQQLNIRELGEAGGNREVRPESPVLLPELCPDTGQGNR